MHALKNLFATQLTEKPKKQKKREGGENKRSSHLGWTYVAETPDAWPKPVRTYQSLFAAAASYTYFTPNTFYHDRKREKETLRWINAFSLDIDVVRYETITFPDVIEAISAAGLPHPTLVVQTPSGGCHVHWYLDEPKRAMPRVVDHYSNIAKLMADEIDLNVDPAATTAERYFRVPTDDNIVYQSDERTGFDDFCEWFSIHVEQRQTDRPKGRFVIGDDQDLFSEPAIRVLLQGVGEGQRDETCYTLALTYKVSGYDSKQAEAYLLDWNQKNDPPMRQIDVKRKVKSAYKSGSKAGPSAFHIRKHSGLPFTYQVWEQAKPREERVYSHQSEWEEDLLMHLHARGGSLSGSQRELAAEVGMPYSTFKKVAKSLVDAQNLHKATTRGRNACTTITLPNLHPSADIEAEGVHVDEVVEEVPVAATIDEPEPSEKPETPVAAGDPTDEYPIPENGLNSNTLKAGVVGGHSFDSVTGKGATDFDLGPALAPVPSHIPARFVRAFFHRDYKDGRLLFDAWGRVQLAFKSFDLSFGVIGDYYLQLVVDAVGTAFGTKNLTHDRDGFMRYLFGTVKGMLREDRERELGDGNDSENIWPFVPIPPIIFPINPI